MFRFFIVFLVIILTLFLLQITQYAQDAFITPFTSFVAAISAWVVQIFDPAVISSGNTLGDPLLHKQILIVPGCNGVEAMIILFAAVIAFPAPLVYKLKGLMWGFLAIHSLNTVRIISLFYLLQWDRNWFEWFHMYLWQALIILDALVVWLIWLRYLPNQSKQTDQADPSDTHTAPSPS